MKLNARFVISPSAIARQVGDESVILQLESGIYFGLDGAGPKIWALLAQGSSFGEIYEVLFAEYEVSREKLKQDIALLIDEFLANQLIIPAE